MKPETQTLEMVGVTTEGTPVYGEKVFTLADAAKAANGLFNALTEAIGDPATAVEVLNNITAGIEADPEFSKQILTPDNIARVYELKAKADSGKITLDDIERAFPIIAEKFPMWSMIKGFKFF